MRNLAALATVVVAATACGGPEPPLGEPDVVGVVVERDDGRGFRVRYGAPSRLDCNTVWIWPARGSGVLRETTTGDYEEAAWSDVGVGRVVEAWGDPDLPELPSCPSVFPTMAVVLKPQES